MSNEDRALGHEGAGHTSDCFGDTCSKECVCGTCPPLPVTRELPQEDMDVTIQAPFEEDMWDVTVIHKGKVVRARFTERGWRHHPDGNPFFFQDEIERALA